MFRIRTCTTQPSVLLAAIISQCRQCAGHLPSEALSGAADDEQVVVSDKIVDGVVSRVYESRGFAVIQESLTGLEYVYRIRAQSQHQPDRVAVAGNNVQFRCAESKLTSRVLMAVDVTVKSVEEAAAIRRSVVDVDEVVRSFENPEWCSILDDDVDRDVRRQWVRSDREFCVTSEDLAATWKEWNSTSPLSVAADPLDLDGTSTNPLEQARRLTADFEPGLRWR